ncbi:MAG: hypothetical protein AB1714_27300 [Acidobacteriota bacterium]
MRLISDGAGAHEPETRRGGDTETEKRREAEYMVRARSSPTIPPQGELAD